MLIQQNAKRRHYLLGAFALLVAALIAGFVFEKNFAGWFSDRLLGNASLQSEVLSFLERSGWKPSGERVIVEGQQSEIAYMERLLKQHGAAPLEPLPPMHMTPSSS